MKIIDLSYPIEQHFKFPFQKKIERDYSPTFRCSIHGLGMHTFTHCDSELHILPNNRSVSEVPLEQWCGDASVIDLSKEIQSNTPVTEELCNQHGQHVKENDIVIIRTDWPLKCDWKTKEFWSTAPYIIEDACEWLVDHKVKTVGYDFPNDFIIRDGILNPGKKHTLADYTAHRIMLPKKILFIENMTNLHLITKNRFLFIGLPLFITGTGGAPMRCIAIEEL